MNTLQRSRRMMARIRNIRNGIQLTAKCVPGRALATTGAAVLMALSAPGYCAELSAETKANLETALHSEAYEYLLYSAYATQAILTGELEAARLLRQVAEDEGLDHFARELALIGKVGPTATNVSDAIKSEMNEQIGFYTKFAEAAEKAGDKKAAALFREVAQDEKHHFELLKAIELGKPGSP